MHARLRIALPLLPVLLIGCSHEPVSSPIDVPVARGAAGLMEITISGIGTPQQRASARAIAAEPGGAAVATSATSRTWNRLAVTGDPGRLTPLTGDGTIQLVGLSTASFTYGTRGAGGYRYVSATFKVRNASNLGLNTAYTSPRTNLTLLGVNGPTSLSGTAITALQKFDGSAASSTIAAQMRPTGWADLSNSAAVTSHGMDVLQLYTEDEVAPAVLTPPASSSVLPYGFVVRNPASSSSRTLPASPAANQFDGLLTIAYKVPLQAAATDDPYSITGLFLAVDDAQTYVTQSLEDSDATATAAIAARATALTAKMRSLVYSWVGSNAAQFICNARSAGTAGAPTAFLADSITVSSFSPTIGTLAGTSQSFSSTFSQAMSLASASFTTFAGNGTQSGRTFRTGSYSGGQTLTWPTGTLFPGEHVEIALTPKLLGTATPGARSCPYVYRYRVATGTASGSFTAGTPFAVDSAPWAIATGDFDGDGKLDVVAVGAQKKSTTAIYTALVLQGDGLGGFTSKGTTGVLGTHPFGVAVGDFNGDGKLDIVTTSQDNGSAAILINNGSFSFSATDLAVSGVGDGPTGVAVADVNGDGNLDIITANVFASTVSVLLGDGAGHFTQALGSPMSIGTGNGPVAVAIGDVNNDRKLDIVAADFGSGKVTVLLNDGSGRFSQATNSPFTVGSSPFAVAVGDLNGDGNLDIVTANSGSNNVSVLLGVGNGSFNAASPVSVGASPMGIALGDMDGGGVLDIVVSDSSSSDVRVLPGNGNGTFGSATTFSFAAGTQPIGVALGSFITTGNKLGIAVANGLVSNVTVLTR